MEKKNKIYVPIIQVRIRSVSEWWKNKAQELGYEITGKPLSSGEKQKAEKLIKQKAKQLVEQWEKENSQGVL